MELNHKHNIVNLGTTVSVMSLTSYPSGKNSSTHGKGGCLDVFNKSYLLSLMEYEPWIIQLLTYIPKLFRLWTNSDVGEFYTSCQFHFPFI